MKHRTFFAACKIWSLLLIVNSCRMQSTGLYHRILVEFEMHKENVQDLGIKFLLCLGANVIRVAAWARVSESALQQKKNFQIITRQVFLQWEVCTGKNCRVNLFETVSLIISCSFLHIGKCWALEWSRERKVCIVSIGKLDTQFRWLKRQVCTYYQLKWRPDTQNKIIWCHMWNFLQHNQKFIEMVKEDQL